MGRIGLVAVFAALLLAGAPAVAEPGRLKPASEDGTAALSALRRAHGLPAVRRDPWLDRVAERQARAMAKHGRLSHDIDGSFAHRMEQAGFTYGSSAENLGYGYDTLAEALQGWMASAGHRANLMKSWATRMGIASARDADRRLYWALVLASDDKPPPTLGGAVTRATQASPTQGKASAKKWQR